MGAHTPVAVKKKDGEKEDNEGDECGGAEVGRGGIINTRINHDGKRGWLRPSIRIARKESERVM